MDVDQERGGQEGERKQSWHRQGDDSSTKKRSNIKCSLCGDNPAIRCLKTPQGHLSSKKKHLGNLFDESVVFRRVSRDVKRRGLGKKGGQYGGWEVGV